MATWVTPKRAAEILLEKDPNTPIKEKTIRRLISEGFPCLKFTSRCLLNMDTFEQDLIEFSKLKAEKEQQEKRKLYPETPPVVNGIRRINP